MINYKNISDLNGLASNLHTSENFIKSLMYSSVVHYHVVRIPKSGKRGFRLLYLANDHLKFVQKVLRDDLVMRKNHLECVHGFIRERSILTNAKQHLAQKVVLNVDIEDYFKSITSGMVADVFENFGAKPEIAKIIASLCTCHNHLVPGTVCAPIISNYVFIKCDIALMELANNYDCHYTRYVDDLTFSGNKTPNQKQISEVIKPFGFQLNKKKTSLQRRGRRQYVTGLTVFDKTTPRIPRQQKKQLRMEIFYMKKYGVREHIKRSGAAMPDWVYIQRIEGLLSYYFSIEPSFAKKYFGEFISIKNNWQENIQGNDYIKY